MDDLLGLPLEAALGALRGRGIENVRVTQTHAPRKPEAQGTPRVIRASAEGLLVARFPDEVGRQLEEKAD